MNGKWETLTLIVTLWFYCKYIKWQDTLYWYCIRYDRIRRYHVLIVDPVYVMWYPPRNIPIYVTVLQGCWLGDHVIEAAVSCIQWLDAYRVKRLSGQYLTLKKLSSVCCVLFVITKSYLVFISCTFTFGVRGCYMSLLLLQ